MSAHGLSFANNRAEVGGGDLALSGSTTVAELSNTTFARARTTEPLPHDECGGGSVLVEGAALTLAGAHWEECATHSAGGALLARGGARVVLAGGLVRNCSAASGGGFALDGAVLTAEAVVFAGNRATSLHGGALRALGDAAATLRNCTLRDNAAARGGGGAMYWDPLAMATPPDLDAPTWRSAAVGGNAALYGAIAATAPNRTNVSIASGGTAIATSNEELPYDLYLEVGTAVVLGTAVGGETYDLYLGVDILRILQRAPRLLCLYKNPFLSLREFLRAALNRRVEDELMHPTARCSTTTAPASARSVSAPPAPRPPPPVPRSRPSARRLTRWRRGGTYLPG